MNEKDKFNQKPPSERLQVLSGVTGRNAEHQIVVEMIKLEKRLTAVETILRKFPAVRKYLENEPDLSLTR